MSKIHYFRNKFSKIAKRWGLFATQRSLTFDFGDLKFYLFILFIYWRVSSPTKSGCITQIQGRL